MISGAAEIKLKNTTETKVTQNAYPQKAGDLKRLIKVTNTAPAPSKGIGSFRVSGR